MYPPPSATSITAKLAQDLDDQFFTSDPSGYFRARLRALVASGASWDSTDKLTSDVQRLLGARASLLTDVDPRTREVQVAVDAIAIRHQIAEALLRLLHALLHVEAATDPSTWVALTDSPNSMKDVVEQNRAALEKAPEGADERLADLLLPTPAKEDGAQAVLAESVEESRRIHIEWVNFAIGLMGQRDPDLSAAHNKFKHGLAVRAQDDDLLSFTPAGPSPDSTFEAAVLNGPDAAALMDGVTAEFLARPSRKHGLELTQLKTDPAATIAEAGALMLTHALLFHHAAAHHFADHETPRGRQVPAFPGRFIGGPSPTNLRADRPFALRFPLSFPVREGSSAKPLFFWTDGSLQELTLGPVQQARVVDSSAGENGRVR